MLVALSTFLGAASRREISVQISVICADFNFGFRSCFWSRSLLLMSTVPGCFWSEKSLGVNHFVSRSVWDLVACGGSTRSNFAQKTIRLILEDSRNDPVRTRVSGASGGSVLSLISVPFGLKNCGAEQSWENILDSSDWSCFEVDRKPDMFNFLISKVKDVPESSVKEDLDNKNDEAEVERLKEEEKQRKRDEEAERLRKEKEKEIEDKIGPPPEKPLPGDCCGNGCTPCIWDTYWEEVANYKKLRESVEKSE